MVGDDLSIVNEVLSGNREAYAALIARHQGSILRLCTSILRDSELARDASQDTFIKAFRSLRQYQKKAPFTAWLNQIATYHCMDLLRKRKRSAELSLDALLEQGSEALNRILSDPVDPARRVEPIMAIEEMLNTLPPDYRTVLLLREVEDHSYEDIAAIMKCTVDSVKARLKRARARLAESLRHFN